MRGSVFLAVTLCGAAALTLGGCSKGADQSGGQSEAAPAATEEYVAGPLEKYLSALDDGQEYTDADAAQDDKKYQEDIAACMAEEGFEYIPDTNGYVSVTSTDMTGPQWGTLEFAKQYGYGIVSWPEEEVSDDSMTEYVDPNAEYRDSLSKSEKEAYDRTLYGEQVYVESENSDTDEVVEYDPSQNGCYGKATYGESDGDNYYEDPDFTDLFDAANELWTSMETSPEMTALEAEWSTCMGDAGFPGLTVKNEAEDSLYSEYIALANSKNEPSKAELDAFQAKEIKQAVADQECAKKVKYDETQQQIDFARQEKFISEHKAELDALIAKYGKK